MRKLRVNLKKKFFATIAIASFIELTTTNILAAEVNSAATELKSATVDVKSTVFDAMNKSNLVVDFSPNSADLSESQKSDIKALIKSLDVSPKYLKVALAGWSDHPFPAGSETKLSTLDTSLAEKRLYAVSKYISGIADFRTTDKFNMAEKTNMLSKLFGTDDADLKKDMTGRTDEVSEISLLAEIFKEKGKESKVVVVFYDAKTLLNN